MRSSPVGRRAVIGVALVLCLSGGIGLGMSVAAGDAAGLSVASKPLSTYGTCTLTATPTTTTVVADAEIRQSNGNNNYGTATTMVITSANGSNRRGHVYFDLAACSPAVPVTAIVRLATLRLFMTGQPAVCRTIDLFPVTAAWTETGLTWNNQPFGTTLNNPPTAARTGSFDVGSPVGCQNRTTNVYIVGGTVTDDVQAFVSGAVVNRGWMLRDDVENSATTRTVTFSAKQLGTISRVPQLVITYVIIP